MEFQRKWRKIDREFQRAAYNSKIQLTVSPRWMQLTAHLCSHTLPTTLGAAHVRSLLAVVIASTLASSPLAAPALLPAQDGRADF